MINILLIGASGHSKMVIDIIQKNQNYNIIGFIDSFKQLGEKIYGFTILGHEEDITELVIKHNIEGAFICIGDNNARMLIKEKIDKLMPQLSYISVIHPSAILATDILVPEGTVIMAGAIVNADAKLGKFCILNTKASLGHDSVMDDFSSLASGVTIGGNVNIGFCSAICLGASIIQNVNIGSHTIIGAGALVIKSLGNRLQAFGVPVNTVKKRATNSKYLG